MSVLLPNTGLRYEYVRTVLIFFRPVSLDHLFEAVVLLLSFWQLLSQNEDKLLVAVHHAKVLTLDNLQSHRVPVEFCYVKFCWNRNLKDYFFQDAYPEKNIYLFSFSHMTYLFYWHVLMYKILVSFSCVCNQTSPKLNDRFLCNFYVHSVGLRIGFNLLRRYP